VGSNPVRHRDGPGGVRARGEREERRGEKGG